jgi:uncharacterized delta-60 repeat protein
MWFSSWLQKTARGASSKARATKRADRRRRRPAPDLERLEDRLAPSAGQLDPTFGTGGMVATNFDGLASSKGDAVAIQSDGKVVVVGQSSELTVVRYNSDGSLDAGFGTNGQVAFQFASSFAAYDNVGGVAIDASGHIIVAGTTSSTRASVAAFVVAELNADGSSNTSFGTGGQTSVSFGSDSDGSATGVAVDAAGHIVVAGYTSSISSPPSFAVARLNGDGTPDTHFGQGGQTSVRFGSDSDVPFYGTSVAVDPSGRVVLAGTVTDSTRDYSAVARLNAVDGSLDTTFGTGGETIVSFGSGNSDAAGVAVDTAGHIVVADTYTPGYPQPTTFAVARLTGDGNLDSTFGTNGETTIHFGGGYVYSDAIGLAVDASDRIVVAGFAANPSQSNGADLRAAARLTSDGTLDSSFGAGGTALDSYTQYISSNASGVALDASGRVVVVGTAYAFSNGFNGLYYHIAVSRLDGGGNPDTGWGGTGQVITDILGPDADYAIGLTFTQPDGKTVVVGTTQPAVGAASLIAVRYDTDGSLDSTFGQGGKATLYANTGTDGGLPQAVTMDGSGRLLVGGLGFGVTRFDADGSPDSTFGQDGDAFVPVGPTGSYATLAGLAVDAAGHILLAGADRPSFSSGTSSFAVARLNSDGSQDTSFGTGGQTLISFGNDPQEIDTAAGVAVDSSGRVVVGGTFSNSSVSGFAVARLDAHGNLDTTFGTGGETVVGTGTIYDSYPAAGVALDPAGNIVVAGPTPLTDPFSGSSVLGYTVARLTAADGRLDPSFGSGGVATVANFGPGFYYPLATRMAIDSAGRIALAGTAEQDTTSTLFAALFEADGRPDVDFGAGGKVTVTHFSAYYTFSGMGIDPAGRLVVAGTINDSSPTGYDFSLVRFLGHDPVVEAGSAHFAAALRAAVAALRAAPPPGTPRVVVHITDPSQMPAVISAVAGLPASSSGPEVEVLLDTVAGTYQPGRVSVPAGLRLIFDGDGGVGGTVTLAGSTKPALTLLSGDLLIRDGVAVVGSGPAPALRVLGGQLTLRASTVTEHTTTAHQAALVIKGGQVDLGYDPANPFYFNFNINAFNVTGPGKFIRLTGPNDVQNVVATFSLNDAFLSAYQTEDRIDDSLDGEGGGTVFLGPDSVYVSANSGSFQSAVDVVPSGGFVYVQTGVKGAYSVGGKLLTIAFDSGQTIVQQADTLDAAKRELLVQDTENSYDTIKFAAGTNAGEVRVKIDGMAEGTFLPTSRIVADGGRGAAIQVANGVVVPAWLYGGGGGSLVGGGGNDVLIGGLGDSLTGGAGRGLLIGYEGNSITSRSGQDLIISGYTEYIYDEVALSAIMAEWASADSLAARIANLTGNTASPLFSAGRKNGNYFLIDSGPNQTVFNDFGSDAVTAGSGIDWIIAGTADTIAGVRKNDVVFIFGP